MSTAATLRTSLKRQRSSVDLLLGLVVGAPIAALVVALAIAPRDPEPAELQTVDPVAFYQM
jgi:hypothetical protein